MKAAVLEAFKTPMKMHNNWPDPECGPAEAIIKVEANGICRSDWHVCEGDWEWIGLQPELPHVIGHEYCGIVEEVGAQVTSFRKGDRVICPFNFGCGNCEFCHSGHQNTCTNFEGAGFVQPGGYGEYAVVSRADINLVALPESIPFVEAASMGCRFMTSFHGIVDQAQVGAGDWVAIHGCGGIGLAATQIATALGANVIAVDINDESLAVAKQMGALHTVNAAKDDAPAAVVELSGGGANVSVDALGIATTCLNSVMSLRSRGRHLQIGLTTQAEKGFVSLPVDIMVARELQFVGTIGMQPQRYPSMLNMVESGKLTPGRMVTNVIPIEEAAGVITSMGNYGTVGTTVVKW
ncbi:MAG: alcohol dehydrogenase [Gammaproteobacteria bacterium]|nr:MAG: alcohol dehydrogenase [Gammaproteobacteria bacterium]RLA50138.1 MAG: alcohol dehydrogenase [Gammaproteobacteria bacterium]